MTTRDALEGVLESEGYGVTRALTLFYAVMLLLSHYGTLLCCHAPALHGPPTEGHAKVLGNTFRLSWLPLNHSTV